MRRTYLKTRPLYGIIHDRKSASPLPQSSCRLVSIWKEVIRKEMAGPSSGIEIDEEVVDEYTHVVQKKKKYCLFKMSDDNKHIQVEVAGDQKETYEDCRQKLVGDGLPHYAVVDFDVEESREGVGVAKTSKVVLMKWIPESCPVKSKMLYTSTFNALKTKLNGAALYLECHDESEIEGSSIAERCKNKK